MHVTQYIKRRGNKPLISVEIIPPKKGRSMEEIFGELEKLNKHHLTFMSVTSHAHERTIEKRDGDMIERVKRKRLDTNAICVAVKARLDIEPTPHIICAGFTKDETEDELCTLHFHGITNVLALRGDIPLHLRGRVTNGFLNKHASDLVEQIVNMNKGVYLDHIEDPVKTNFCIGVAGYPEKHYEAPDLKTDLAFLKEKVDLGAHFIITQMFFDNEAFYRFVEKARKIGINIPIIPGIKPLYKKRQLTVLPKIFHISIPKSLRKKIDRFSSDEDVRKAGVEYCIKQSQDLLESGVPGLHYYTMNASQPTEEILKNVVV